MLALGLTVLLFTVWLALGWAVLGLLRMERDAFQQLLLAPAVGVATTILPVFWLHRVGFPVRDFAAPLAIVLVTVAAGAVWLRRPATSRRTGLAALAVAFLALALVGYPMLEFGFDWLSFVNADMTNYSLLAHRALDHGRLDPPDLDALRGGRDYSLYFWAYDAVSIRPATQLLLAMVAALTGLSPDRAFMPLIVAVHLILVSAVAGLVCQTASHRRAALAAGVLLAASAQVTLGTIYQLLAQVLGLGLVAATAAVLLAGGAEDLQRGALRRAALAGILGAALLVAYPEIVPFLGLATVIQVTVTALRHRERLRATLLLLVLAAVVSAAVLSSYMVDAARLLARQAGVGASSWANELFPYYRVPSGLALLWGLTPMFRQLPREPWGSAAVATGASLLALAAILAARQAWRGQPCACLALAMLAAVPPLYAGRAGFGLFKLGMFVIPFLLGVLALAFLDRDRPRILPLVAIGLLGLPGQLAYVQASRGGGGPVEVRDASRARVSQAFAELVARAPVSRLDSGTPNISLARLQALRAAGRSVVFRSRDFFGALSEAFASDTDPAYGTISRMNAVHEQINPTVEFALTGAPDEQRTNEFTQIGLWPPRGQDGPAFSCELLVLDGRSQTVLNARRYEAGDVSPFLAIPCAQARNILIFVHSALGNHYYTFGERRRVALYQVERDPLFFTERTMAGVGRHLLFEVIGPTRRIRLGIELTVSYKGDEENRLPPAAATGVAREPLPLLGRGSARVFSPPLGPQWINGRAYVALDMGVEGRLFPLRRSGLMRLYGTDIPLDPRYLTGFVRDISVLSDEEYRALAPPPGIASFPGGLGDPAVEYSGLYEDGWTAEAAYVVLARPPGTATLAIEGHVPGLDPSFRTDCVVSIDGTEAGRRSLEPGDFSLALPATPGPGRARVDLRCSAIQRLPAGDGRPVALRLRTIGFR